jgi:ssDNA-binding Zn-finger/Zn-ribbon topoisomerase 1
MTGKWKHYCENEKEHVEIDKDEECDWCGVTKNTMKWGGFEDALIGIAKRYTKSPLYCYSYSRCIKILQERDGMSEEEAEDYFNFNYVCAWIGEGTPLILYNEYWYDWIKDGNSSSRH